MRRKRRPRWRWQRTLAWAGLAAIIVLAISVFVDISWRWQGYRLSVTASRLRWAHIAMEDARFEQGIAKSMIPEVDWRPIDPWLVEWHISRTLSFVTVRWMYAPIALGIWAVFYFGRAAGMRKANPDACRRCGYPLGAGEGPGPGSRTCSECGTRNPPARAPRAASLDASVPDA